MNDIVKISMITKVEDFISTIPRASGFVTSVTLCRSLLVECLFDCFFVNCPEVDPCSGYFCFNSMVF